eukprot:gene7670-15702_t
MLFSNNSCIIDDAATTSVENNILNVAIIGGGLGGLAAALALQRNGIECRVFERDKRLSDRNQGYGMTLTNNSKGPLARLGLLDTCIICDCPSNCHWIFSSSGDILGYYGRAFKHNTEQCNPERGNLRIPREDLRRMLLESLKPGTVQWDKRLTYIQETHDFVKCEFEDGTIYQSDLLIGADGIGSVVRQARDFMLHTGLKEFSSLKSSIEQKIPHAKRMKKDSSDCSTSISNTTSSSTTELKYLGVAAIIGISTATHTLLEKQGFYVLDGQHRLFTMPFRCLSGHEQEKDITVVTASDSSNSTISTPTSILTSPYQTMWQLSFSESDEMVARQLRCSSESEMTTEALRRTEHWFQPVHDLIRGTVPGEIWATPLYDREPMEQWRRGEGSRVSVLGDACHPMSMFKGQGANQALEDGPLLASWLNRPTTRTADRGSGGSGSGGSGDLIKPLNREVLLTRMRCFEREMIARTAPKVAASRLAASQYHSNSALNDEKYGIEGVPVAIQGDVISHLRTHGITAHMGGDLEKQVANMILKRESEVNYINVKEG